MFSPFIGLFLFHKIHFFVSILESIAIIVTGIMHVKRYRKERLVVGCISSIYLSCMLYYMLLGRPFQNERSVELHLFWSYKIAYETHNTMLLLGNIANILVFFILTLLLCYLFLKPLACVCAVSLLSVFIEIIQLIFKLGVFEFDDIFHNVVGVGLAYIAFNRFFCLENSDVDINEKLI